MHDTSKNIEDDQNQQPQPVPRERMADLPPAERIERRTVELRAAIIAGDSISQFPEFIQRYYAGKLDDDSFWEGKERPTKRYEQISDLFEENWEYLKALAEYGAVLQGSLVIALFVGLKKKSEIKNFDLDVLVPIEKIPAINEKFEKKLTRNVRVDLDEDLLEEKNNKEYFSAGFGQLVSPNDPTVSSIDIYAGGAKDENGERKYVSRVEWMPRVKNNPNDPEELVPYSYDPASDRHDMCHSIVIRNKNKEELKLYFVLPNPEKYYQGGEDNPKQRNAKESEIARAAIQTLEGAEDPVFQLQ